jgi:hypothetical protein
MQCRNELIRATQPLTHALGARPAVQPQSCREIRVKLRNHQNINTTNPTRKETRFPFHHYVTFRVCPTVKSSHRAKLFHADYSNACCLVFRMMGGTHHHQQSITTPAWPGAMLTMP